MADLFLNPPAGNTYLRNPERQTPHGEFANVGAWAPDALGMLAQILSVGSVPPMLLGMVPPPLGPGLVPKTKEAVRYADWIENSLPKLAAALQRRIPNRIDLRVPPEHRQVISSLTAPTAAAWEVGVHTPETAASQGLQLPQSGYFDLITNLLKLLYFKKNRDMFGPTASYPYGPVMPQAAQIARRFHPEETVSEKIGGEAATRLLAVEELANNMFKRRFIKPSPGE